MFDFTENITIQVPDVRRQLDAFSESSFSESHKMIFEVAAIHEGLTSNYNHYGKEQLERSLPSWTEPYRKPILLNHDPESDPLGRVMKARMDAETDGSPFVRLQVAITNAEAMQRIADERYITGSVGGKAKEAQCSICETDWAEASMFSKAPCSHNRGKVYAGKLAYFKLGELQWKEYSFVNMPADQRSGVLAGTFAAGESDSEPIYQSHIYALDMDNESIVEFTEADSSVEILESMRKKQASYTYMDLKGTWLSASAAEHLKNDKNDENGVKTSIADTISREATSDVADSDTEEKDMPEAQVEQEKDVLSVLEDLSDHLATSPEEKGDNKPEGQETGDVETPVNREGAPEDDDAAGDEDAEGKEESDTGDSTDDDKEDMTEEPAADGDESEQSASDESEPEGTGDESATADEATDSTDEELKDEEVTTPESEETAEGTDDEAQAELQKRIEDLTSENDKLKAMLHKVLAERVVDRKIDLKMVDAETRAEALEEHVGRTAASLADSYKDLSKQTYVPSDEDKEAAIAALRQDYKNTESSAASDEDEQDAVSPVTAFENRIVDALMGRSSL